MARFLSPEQSGGHSRQLRLTHDPLPITRDTRIALFLMEELVEAVRGNEPDAFRALLSERIEELGVTEVEELLLELHNSFRIQKIRTG